MGQAFAARASSRVAAVPIAPKVRCPLATAIFPMITGQTGKRAIFEAAADFDLELIEQRTLDANIQELIYRPTRHV